MFLFVLVWIHQGRQWKRKSHPSSPASTPPDWRNASLLTWTTVHPLVNARKRAVPWVPLDSVGFIMAAASVLARPVWVTARTNRSVRSAPLKTTELQWVTDWLSIYWKEQLWGTRQSLSSVRWNERWVQKSWSDSKTCTGIFVWSDIIKHILNKNMTRQNAWMGVINIM